MISAVVVMPIYKDLNFLNSNERLSLIQCFKLLNKHHVCFIGPDNINFSDYEAMAIGFKVKCLYKNFDNNYFKNIEGYNKLLLSHTFYHSLKEFTYILIYQTDSFVFKDELIFWCRQEYDYIGAPWFHGWIKPSKSNKIISAGNGGFSLRNIEKSLKILKRVAWVKKIKKLTAKLDNKRFSFFIRVLLIFNFYFKIKDTHPLLYLLTGYDNEDIFWAVHAGNAFKDFKVASPEQSIRFSFEVNPALLYEMNGHKLPFGCHAWEKYDPVFWEQFIA